MNKFQMSDGTLDNLNLKDLAGERIWQSEMKALAGNYGTSRAYRVWIVVLLLFILLACISFVAFEESDPTFAHGEGVTYSEQSKFRGNSKPNKTVKLVFLEPPNWTKLHDSGSHLVILKHEENITYTMRLKKPNDLFLPEAIFKEEYHEEMHCVFSGKIRSPSGKLVGMASLSSCRLQTAFEGLIFLEGEHYHIAPDDEHFGHARVERSNSRKNAKNPGSKKRVVNHKLTKAETSSQSLSRRTDSKQVPPEELDKAREQMLRDQDPLDDETGEEDDEDDQNDDFGTNGLSGSQVHNPYIGEDDSTGLDDALGANLLSNKNTKSKTFQKSQKTVTKTKVIELAIFTDEKFYRKWAADYPQDTQRRLNQYILAMVNNMNYLYAQPSMKESITFRLVYLEVQKTTPSGLKITANADKYLDNFCAYAGKKDTNGALWDHAMMITGYDLLDEKGTPNNLGIAFTSTMCLRYYSCSLIEFVKGFETAFTATHEVGHSLGMYHDGESLNKNCDQSKYLMAALSGKGQIYWSDCSNKNLQNFFATGNPEPTKIERKYVPRCLLKKGAKQTRILYARGKFPGQIFDAKRQCETACDGCRPYITSSYPYNNICWMLHCQTPSKSIIDGHPALEGTSCGENRLCRNGKCIPLS